MSLGVGTGVVFVDCRGLPCADHTAVVDFVVGVGVLAVLDAVLLQRLSAYL